MRPTIWLVTSLLFSSPLVLGVTSARAQDAVYVAAYFEVGPASTKSADTLLKQYVSETRKEDGNQRAELLEEIGRPNRFVILETWKDQHALEAHQKATYTTQFRDKMKEIQDSPSDERINSGLDVASGAGASARKPIFVVTHVDVVPPRKDDCVSLLKTMADNARKDGGNLRYEVQQQQSRPNHFTVAEAWKDRKALDAHQTATHTREFRQKLAPMEGALYDERVYRLLNDGNRG